MNTTKNMIRTATAMVLMAAMLTINFTNTAFAASPGALDISFDGDGKVITNVINADNGNDVAIQPDGKIVVVGRSNLGAGGVAFDFTVIRYNPDGSLDTTFDTDGKVTTDFGAIDRANGVAIQSDGKIVVAGESDPVGAGTGDFAIARYNANGSLDTTFDTDGKVVTDFAAANDRANSVTVQLDGKIIAGGTASAVDVGLARYNTNGSLDTTFNTDGKQTIDFGTVFDDGNQIDLQPDGKIVIAGGNVVDFVVARLTTAGGLDTTFDTDGKVTTDFGSGETANSVSVQADGKIVVAGLSNTNCALARYNANGSLDTSFDGDGKVITDFSSGVNDSIQDIGIDAKGKIVAAVTGNGSLNALRYNPNGSLDTTFGSVGGVSILVQTSDNARAIALSADGNIVVVGDANSDISMIRLNANSQPTASSDFDGDSAADTTVFRPSSGTWFTLRSSDQTVTIEQFGLTGDVPIDGDFDGDGRADVAIFRPSSGVWFFKRSSNGTVLGAQFGQTGDKPVAGDYDKDGKTDIAIFRPSDGNNFVLRSSTNFSTFFGYPFGTNGDINIMGGAQ